MQGIVIQGTTEYYKEICDNWSRWPNIVFSIRDDSPQEHIDYIKSTGIEVVLYPKDTFPGDQNINYQALSTFNGLQVLQSRGVTEALKIRSDHTVSNVKDLLEILYGRKMSFIALSNVHIRRDITYQLGNYTSHGHDYPCDNILYGEIHNMLSMFNFQVDKYYNVPPEAFILYNYLTNKKIPIDFSYENLTRHGITFFLRDIVNKRIKINWLKRNQELTQLYNNEYYRF